MKQITISIVLIIIYAIAFISVIHIFGKKRKDSDKQKLSELSPADLTGLYNSREISIMRGKPDLVIDHEQQYKILRELIRRIDNIDWDN